MNRADQFAKLSAESGKWDLVIIGGGATGLATALDAVTRGLKTVLLEQADFAESTSSKSTKLIHGGVRYLRGGEFSLVYEALIERGRLLKNAPNLVHPLSLVVPAYRWYDRFYYGTGLTLYDLLAGKFGIQSTKHLSKEKTLEVCSNLNQENLRGGTLYHDAQFDDARLAIAMAKTADAEGAVVLNHVRVTELIKENDMVRGVRARDRLSGDEIQIAGKMVINATGVFTDSIRKMDNPNAGNCITPSQGIHIVLDRSFLGSGSNSGVMIPETIDGRVLFAIPWHNRVILGTTDTPDVKVELDPEPLSEEIDYLIEHAAGFLSRSPSRDDIKSAFAGLRPLVTPPKSSSGKTSKISRKHSLFLSRSGLLTIAGGKWTTCRAMAESVVDRALSVCSDLSRGECRTKDFPLLDQSSASEHLEKEPELAELLDDDLNYTMADVAAAARDEQAETLDDVLSRRTRCKMLDASATSRCAEKVARWMAKERGKDEAWIERELKRIAH